MPDAGPVSMEVFHVHLRLTHSLSYTHTLTHTHTHMPIMHVLCLHCEDCFTKLLCLHIRPHIFPLDPWHKFMLFSRSSSKKLRATAISLWTNSQIYPLFLTTTDLCCSLPHTLPVSSWTLVNALFTQEPGALLAWREVSEGSCPLIF